MGMTDDAFELFDTAALQGIYVVLSDADKDKIKEVFDRDYNGSEYAIRTRGRAYAAYCAMRDLGFIMPPPPPLPSEAGAAEYDEIVAAQDLMGG